MKMFLFYFFVFFLVSNVFCQTKEEVKIKTTAQCNMCKERIEKKIKKEKGVYSVNVNLDTKYVTIFYNPQKTSPDKLRLAISKLGYQADDIKPDPIAYEKLPTCCKLPKDRKE